MKAKDLEGTAPENDGKPSPLNIIVDTPPKEEKFFQREAVIPGAADEFGDNKRYLREPREELEC